MVAYADDAAVIVQAGTRRGMQEKLEGVAEKLAKWTESMKLELSLKKTVVMKLRVIKENVGKRQKPKDHGWKMVVRMRGGRLETVRMVKYLGIWIEEDMRGDSHVREIGNKVVELMTVFSREIRVERGLEFRTMMGLYRKVIEPGMLYGVEFWGEEVGRRIVLRRKWKAVQRKILVKALSAYRTVSADAVCVLAGVEPVELRIEMLVGVAEDVRNGMDKKESTVRREQVMMGKWQQEWSESVKGRVTYSYLREVNRVDADKWKLNHYVTQVMTGHGNFKAKLESFGLVESGMCEDCGVLEDEYHIVYECLHYEGERGELRRKVEKEGLRWGRESVMLERFRQEFFEVVKRILRVKEEREAQ